MIVEELRVCFLLKANPAVWPSVPLVRLPSFYATHAHFLVWKYLLMNQALALNCPSNFCDSEMRLSCLAYSCDDDGVLCDYAYFLFRDACVIYAIHEF